MTTFSKTKIQKTNEDFKNPTQKISQKFRNTFKKLKIKLDQVKKQIEMEIQSEIENDWLFNNLTSRNQSYSF